MQGAAMHAVIVDGIDFTDAGLRNVDSSISDFTGGDFTRADLRDAVFVDNTMTGTIWSSTLCPDGSNSDDIGGTCLPL
jgi:uncharacterized protein YjbI with pentapeptide repeats